VAAHTDGNQKNHLVCEVGKRRRKFSGKMDLRLVDLDCQRKLGNFLT